MPSVLQGTQSPPSLILNCLPQFFSLTLPSHGCVSSPSRNSPSPHLTSSQGSPPSGPVHRQQWLPGLFPASVQMGSEGREGGPWGVGILVWSCFPRGWGYPDGERRAHSHTTRGFHSTTRCPGRFSGSWCPRCNSEPSTKPSPSAGSPDNL